MDIDVVLKRRKTGLDGAKKPDTQATKSSTKDVKIGLSEWFDDHFESSKTTETFNGKLAWGQANIRGLPSNQN